MQRRKTQPFDRRAASLAEDVAPRPGVFVALDEESAQRLDELDRQVAGCSTGLVVQYDEETTRWLDEFDKQLADWKSQEVQDPALAPLLESAEETLQWYLEWFESEGGQSNKRSRPAGRPFEAQFPRNGKRQRV